MSMTGRDNQIRLENVASDAVPARLRGLVDQSEWSRLNDGQRDYVLDAVERGMRAERALRNAEAHA